MYKIYIGKFIKNGLKEKAKKIFYFIFYKISKKIFKSYSVILNKVYFYFSPVINTTFIRKSGKLYFIPKKIFYKQAISKSVQQLIKSNKNLNISFKINFINNILNIFNKKGIVYNKKLEYYKKILANRIFMKRTFRKKQQNTNHINYYFKRIKRFKKKKIKKFKKKRY